MKRNKLRTLFIGLLISGSVFSYAFLNCCANVKGHLPAIYQETGIEQPGEEEDASINPPDLHLVKHLINLSRKVLPAS